MRKAASKIDWVLVALYAARIAVVGLVLCPFAVVQLACGERSLLNALSGEDRSAIEYPERIEVYRIEPERRPWHLAKAGDVLSQEKPLFPRVVASSQIRERIVGIFKEAEYPPLGTPKCSPEPGWLLRFYRKQTRVDVLFCAMCGAVFLYPKDTRESFNYYIGNPGYELKVILGKLFPEDDGMEQGTDPPPEGLTAGTTAGPESK